MTSHQPSLTINKWHIKCIAFYHSKPFCMFMFLHSCLSPVCFRQSEPCQNLFFFVKNHKNGLFVKYGHINTSLWVMPGLSALNGWSCTCACMCVRVHPRLCHCSGMLPHGWEEMSPSDTTLACFHQGQEHEGPRTEQLLQLTESLEPSEVCVCVGVGGCIMFMVDTQAVLGWSTQIVPVSLWSTCCTLLFAWSFYESQVSSSHSEVRWRIILKWSNWTLKFNFSWYWRNRRHDWMNIDGWLQCNYMLKG